MARKTSQTFMKNPSVRFQRAIAALSELLESEGLDAVRRAYAQTSHEAIQKQSQGASKPRSGVHVCVYRLQGNRCPDHFDHPCDSPSFPGQDHLTEWVKDQNTERILSQPYQLSFEDMRKTVEYCDNMGLRADVTAVNSWHFPGMTLAIEYKRNDQPPKKD